MKSQASHTATILAEAWMHSLILLLLTDTPSIPLKSVMLFVRMKNPKVVFVNLKIQQMVTKTTFTATLAGKKLHANSGNTTARTRP
jgi:hypothetical protein